MFIKILGKNSCLGFGSDLNSDLDPRILFSFPVCNRDLRIGKFCSNRITNRIGSYDSNRISNRIRV